MNKKLFVLLFLFTMLISGCSGAWSRNDMLKKNSELLTKIEDLEAMKDDLNNSKKIIEFYNELSNSNMNSLVLVESKNRITQAKKYSNGVIVANVGVYFYVLVDYYSLKQDYMNLTIMDSYVNSYNGYEYLINEETGLALLYFTISDSSSKVNVTSLGEYSEIFAYLDSMEQKQLNKVMVLNNIKSSTVVYNNTTYDSYIIENMNINNGGLLVNIDNKLMGIYSSKLNVFVNSSLISEIVDFTI